MPNEQIFEIAHRGSKLGITRRVVAGKSETYVGTINGKACAIGPVKSELLNRLIQIAKPYTKGKPRRPTPTPKKNK